MEKIREFSGKIPLSFKITFLIVLSSLIIGINSPDGFAQATKFANVMLFKYFGGFYMFFALLAVVLLIAVGASPLGRVKIGGQDARPQFSYLSWLAMLFCTGMGVGLMFWGATEPLYHYLNPPVSGMENTYEQQITAFKMSFFHWGFTPWAIYGLTAIAVSFLGFNLKRGILFSSLIGGKAKSGKKTGIRSQIIDIIAIIAIFFGIITSFGMGVLLLEGGLGAITNIKPSFGLEVLIIVLATVFYMISTLRGLDKGIKVLSNISMALSFVLFGFILWNTSKVQLGHNAVDTAYFYLKDFINMSIGALDYSNPDFIREWTVKNWSWWIAWAPFVGIFIAITSFGRSIREIALSILMVPGIYSFIWFIVFGTAAINMHTITGLTVSLDNASLVLFNVVDFVTKTPWVSWLTILIAAIFFINSADSATYTLASFTKEKNTLSEKPSRFLQIGWGVLFSVMTALFLFIGGIYILQEITLIFALPFALLLLATFVIFIRSLISYYQENFPAEKQPEKIKKATLKSASNNPG